VRSEDRRRVLRLDVSTLEGTRFTAHARAFVLATGGIENARILLLSEIGTNPDPNKNLVGRYFANHPAVDLAEIQLATREPGFSFYLRTKYAVGFLTFSDAAQRHFELLNTWLEITAALRFDRPDRDRDAELEMQVAHLASDMARLSTGIGKRRRPGARLVLRAITEQTPNPDSRVRLDDDTDRLGQRRAVLDWQLSEFDTVSARRALKLITSEMGIAGLGRVRGVLPDGGLTQVDVRGSHHHMGTTRMHADANQGVVDANCRVHGTDNLFIAGSSVFPTTGISNPTYTILALAFRLAQHLAATA